MNNTNVTHDTGHGGDNHTTEKENDSNDEDHVQEGWEVQNEHEDEQADSHYDEDEHEEHSNEKNDYEKPW